MCKCKISLLYRHMKEHSRKHSVQSNQNYWHLAFVFVYLILITIFALGFGGRLGEFAVLELVVLALATWRVTQLLISDEIFFFIREAAYDISYDKKKDRTYYRRPENGIRRAFYDLLNCSWCVGLWAVLLTMVVYLVVPVGNVFIYVFAIAAIASLLQMIGEIFLDTMKVKKAEAKKVQKSDS